MLCKGMKEPLIHDGLATSTFCAPNKNLTNCIINKLTPKVANKVSKGRPYKCLKTKYSKTNPKNAAVKKEKGAASTK